MVLKEESACKVQLCSPPAQSPSTADERLKFPAPLRVSPTISAFCLCWQVSCHTIWLIKGYIFKFHHCLYFFILFYFFQKNACHLPPDPWEVCRKQKKHILKETHHVTSWQKPENCVFSWSCHSSLGSPLCFLCLGEWQTEGPGICHFMSAP